MDYIQHSSWWIKDSGLQTIRFYSPQPRYPSSPRLIFISSKAHSFACGLKKSRKSRRPQTCLSSQASFTRKQITFIVTRQRNTTEDPPSTLLPNRYHSSPHSSCPFIYSDASLIRKKHPANIRYYKDSQCVHQPLPHYAIKTHAPSLLPRQVFNQLGGTARSCPRLCFYPSGKQHALEFWDYPLPWPAIISRIHITLHTQGGRATI